MTLSMCRFRKSKGLERQDDISASGQPLYYWEGEHQWDERQCLEFGLMIAKDLSS